MTNGNYKKCLLSILNFQLNKYLLVLLVPFFISKRLILCATHSEIFLRLQHSAKVMGLLLAEWLTVCLQASTSTWSSYKANLTDATSRNEADQVELLSGVFEGKSTGCPIGFIVRNTNQHSNDYENMRDVFRPSHADYTYYKKYGIRDHRGGGRSSARITISRCVGGALAKLALRQMGINITAYTSQVGDIAVSHNYSTLDFNEIERNPVRCPDPDKAQEMEQLITEVKAEGDTIGGIITCVVKGCPVGIGEPEFGKLQAMLGAAMLGINAAKGFEYGEGFGCVTSRGSQQNDIFTSNNNKVSTLTNHSGGIQGGISNGEDIYFRVAFKPVATILQEQPTVDKNGNRTSLCVHGRHDPCVLPRAVPVVEAMAAMTILDNIILNNCTKLRF